MHTTLTSSLWRTTANPGGPWFASARRPRRPGPNERGWPAPRLASLTNTRWPTHPAPVAVNA